MRYSLFALYIVIIIFLSGCHHEQHQVIDTPTRSTVSSPSENHTKRALVIGINNYSHQKKESLGNLAYAVNDSSAIATRLESMDFEVDILQDKDATEKNIFDQLGKYREMGCNDQFILFYSGHGDTDEREGYIVSSDGKRISFEKLRDNTFDLPPKHILYIFDSCHSGFFDPAVQAKWPLGESKKESCIVPQVQERELRAAVYTLTAGSSKELTWEGGKCGHSYFTFYLLKGLDGVADINNDCKITASELGVYLTQVIPSQVAGENITAKQIGKNETPLRQNPLFNRVYGEGEITLIPPRCQENQKLDGQQKKNCDTQLVPDKNWEKSDAYKGQSAYKEPSQLLVDNKNNLYVLDAPARKVYKFDAKGKYIRSYSHENWVPTSIALLNNNNFVKSQKTARGQGQFSKLRGKIPQNRTLAVNSSIDSEASSLWVYYSWARNPKQNGEQSKIVIYEGEKKPRRWEVKDSNGEKKNGLTICVYPNAIPQKGLISIC